MQDGLCESFNGLMRDELLNKSLFFELDHERTKIAAWVDDYDLRRSESALGNTPPAAYASILITSAIPRKNGLGSNCRGMTKPWQVEANSKPSNEKTRNLTIT